MAAMSDFLENKLIDQVFRGQAYTFPATLYVGLLTAAPSDAGGGTEVSGGSYARVAVTSNLTNWSGTQGAGTTTAPSGTTGTTSNNTPIEFPAPTANWGQVSHVGVYDSLSGGNLLFWSPLSIAKTVNSGDAAPYYAIGAFSVQIDN